MCDEAFEEKSPGTRKSFRANGTAQFANVWVFRFHCFHFERCSVTDLRLTWLYRLWHHLHGMSFAYQQWIGINKKRVQELPRSLSNNKECLLSIDRYIGSHINSSRDEQRFARGWKEIEINQTDQTEWYICRAQPLRSLSFGIAPSST